MGSVSSGPNDVSFEQANAILPPKALRLIFFRHSIIEATVCVICSCMPSLSHISRHHSVGLSNIAKYFTSLLSTRNYSSGLRRSIGNSSSTNIFRRGFVSRDQSEMRDLPARKHFYTNVERTYQISRDTEHGYVSSNDTYFEV